MTLTVALTLTDTVRVGVNPTNPNPRERRKWWSGVQKCLWQLSVTVVCSVIRPVIPLQTQCYRWAGKQTYLWHCVFYYRAVSYCIMHRYGLARRLSSTGASMTSSGIDRWRLCATTVTPGLTVFAWFGVANVNATPPPTTASPGHVVGHVVAAERDNGSGSDLTGVALQRVTNLPHVEHVMTSYSWWIVVKLNRTSRRRLISWPTFPALSLPLCLKWNNGSYFIADNRRPTTVTNTFEFTSLRVCCWWCSLNCSRRERTCLRQQLRYDTVD